MQKDKKEYRTRINHYIKADKVKVVAEDGTFLGVMSLQEALKIAKEKGVDLVEINSKIYPPLVKTVEFGKYKYELKKQQAEEKKKQKVQLIKELYFHCTTEQNDLDRQIKQAKDFLAEGNKVKMVVKMRGREMAHPEVASDKLNYIIDNLLEVIKDRPPISLDGKNVSIVLCSK